MCDLPKTRRSATTALRRSPCHSIEKRIRNLDCGAVPSAADRWSSSNDSPQHNSNSVLHRSWPRLHEITRLHTHSLPCRASRRSVSPFHPDIFFRSLPRCTSAIDSSVHSAPTPSPPTLTTPANFYTPHSPHSICIRPASAAPAASF